MKNLKKERNYSEHKRLHSLFSGAEARLNRSVHLTPGTNRHSPPCVCPSTFRPWKEFVPVCVPGTWPIHPVLHSSSICPSGWGWRTMQGKTVKLLGPQLVVCKTKSSKNHNNRIQMNQTLCVCCVFQPL